MRTPTAFQLGRFYSKGNNILGGEGEHNHEHDKHEPKVSVVKDVGGCICMSKTILASGNTIRHNGQTTIQGRIATYGITTQLVWL